VRPETLEAELARPDSLGPSGSGVRARGTPGRSVPDAPAPRRRARLGPELSLLQVLARDRERRHERLETVLMAVGPGDFSDEGHRAIFQAFLDDPELKAPPEHLPPEVRRRMDDLLAEPADDAELSHAGRTFTESLTALKRIALERQAEDLDRRIELTTSDEEKRALASEKSGVARELRAMGQGWAHTARKLRMEPRTHTPDGSP
jgi:hypothetical protein